MFIIATQCNDVIISTVLSGVILIALMISSLTRAAAAFRRDNHIRDGKGNARPTQSEPKPFDGAVARKAKEAPNSETFSEGYAQWEPDRQHRSQTRPQTQIPLSAAPKTMLQANHPQRRAEATPPQGGVTYVDSGTVHNTPRSNDKTRRGGFGKNPKAPQKPTGCSEKRSTNSKNTLKPRNPRGRQPQPTGTGTKTTQLWLRRRYRKVREWFLWAGADIGLPYIESVSDLDLVGPPCEHSTAESKANRDGILMNYRRQLWARRAMHAILCFGTSKVTITYILEISHQPIGHLLVVLVGHWLALITSYEGVMRARTGWSAYALEVSGKATAVLACTALVVYTAVWLAAPIITNTSWLQVVQTYLGAPVRYHISQKIAPVAYAYAFFLMFKTSRERDSWLLHGSEKALLVAALIASVRVTVRAISELSFIVCWVSARRGTKAKVHETIYLELQRVLAADQQTDVACAGILHVMIAHYVYALVSTTLVICVIATYWHHGDFAAPCAKPVMYFGNALLLNAAAAMALGIPAALTWVEESESLRAAVAAGADSRHVVRLEVEELYTAIITVADTTNDGSLTYVDRQIIQEILVNPKHINVGPGAPGNADASAFLKAGDTATATLERERGVTSVSPHAEHPDPQGS